MLSSLFRGLNRLMHRSAKSHRRSRTRFSLLRRLTVEPLEKRYVLSLSLGFAAGIGGEDADQGTSVATDAAGNIYFTGGFNGTVDFDPGLGTFNLTSASGQDVFVSKLDREGNFIWAESSDGGGNDLGRAITVDTSGNVYITGAQGNFLDIFVSKLDSAGNFVWTGIMDGTQSSNFGRGIGVDASGSVYTAGYFGGTVDFDPGWARSI